jgi:hypothetical protein
MFSIHFLIGLRYYYGMRIIGHLDMDSSQHDKIVPLLRNLSVPHCSAVKRYSGTLLHGEPPGSPTPSTNPCLGNILWTCA